MIDISPAAAQEIKRIQLSRRQPQSYFRLKVERGGCSGFFYRFEFIDTVTSERLYESHGISILIPENQDAALEGLRLDYSEDLMGGGFRFDNPNVANICSCGLSFALRS
ncbi:MAG: HesB/IscA family protein [Cyanophyceae cyanobacterium]